MGETTAGLAMMTAKNEKIRPILYRLPFTNAIAAPCYLSLPKPSTPCAGIWPSSGSSVPAARLEWNPID